MTLGKKEQRATGLIAEVIFPVQGKVLNFRASRSALRPIQPPIQWVLGDLSPGVKIPGREAGHSPPTTSEIKKNVDLYIHSPIRLHGVVLS
jgi:hypothetical protein